MQPSLLVVICWVQVDWLALSPTLFSLAYFEGCLFLASCFSSCFVASALLYRLQHPIFRQVIEGDVIHLLSEFVRTELDHLNFSNHGWECFEWDGSGSAFDGGVHGEWTAQIVSLFVRKHNSSEGVESTLWQRVEQGHLHHITTAVVGHFILTTLLNSFSLFTINLVKKSLVFVLSRSGHSWGPCQIFLVIPLG